MTYLSNLQRHQKLNRSSKLGWLICPIFVDIKNWIGLPSSVDLFTQFAQIIGLPSLSDRFAQFAQITQFAEIIKFVSLLLSKLLIKWVKFFFIFIKDFGFFHYHFFILHFFLVLFFILIFYYFHFIYLKIVTYVLLLYFNHIWHYFSMYLYFYNLVDEEAHHFYVLFLT